MRDPRRVSGGQFLFVTVLLGIAALVGCSFLAVRAPEPELAFPHAVHLDQALTCKDCHGRMGWERSRPEVCAVCHDRDAVSPATDVVRARIYGGDTRGLTALGDELIFDHARHAGAVACEECHGELARSNVITASFRLGKPDCMGCHSERGASNDCATCHQRVRRDVPPSNHQHAWLLLHGQASRDPSLACELCHQEQGHQQQGGADSCTGCHLTEPPSDHNEQFRRRGHGLLAGMDRDRCQTCHTGDFCSTCHADTPPTSHRGAFGSPRNLHCLGCHQPLASEPGCQLCHLATPSHALATPQPSWHVAGSNCRNCHGMGAPLPHVDNGSECQSCHPL